MVDARFFAGLRDEEIREGFRAMRSNDYRALAADARALLDRARQEGSGQDHPTIEEDRRRLVRRVEATHRIDFHVYSTPGDIDRLANALREFDK